MVVGVGPTQNHEPPVKRATRISDWRPFPLSLPVAGLQSEKVTPEIDKIIQLKKKKTKSKQNSVVYPNSQLRAESRFVRFIILLLR